MWYAQGRRWRNEGSWIDRRHPNPRLIYLEEIRNKRVEIDIGIGKIIEGELFPVPE